MGQVLVKVNGREFPLSCADGQEPRIRRLAQYVDAKVGEFTRAIGQVGEARLLLLARNGDERSRELGRVASLPAVLALPELVLLRVAFRVVRDRRRRVLAFEFGAVERRSQILSQRIEHSKPGVMPRLFVLFARIAESHDQLQRSTSIKN